MGEEYPKGHWRSWENVESVLLELAKEHGRFPTGKEIVDAGYSGMLTGIYYHHGKLTEVRRTMGFSRDTKPPGYWKDWENFKRELESVLDEDGNIPNSTRLEKIERSRIRSAATMYYGGMTAVRERLGKPPGKKKPNRYWHDDEKVFAAIQPVIDKLDGRFPTADELVEHGLGGLASSVQKRHGGLINLAIEMGYEPTQIQAGFYHDWKNVENSLRPVAEKLERMPTWRELYDIDLGACAVAISKYHGGWEVAASKIGYRTATKPNGYYTVWDNVVFEVGQLIELLGGLFPSTSDFQQHKKSSLLNSIKARFGGLPSVRERMGYTTDTKPKGYWQVWEHVEQVLLELIKDLGRFPTREEISKTNSSASSAIGRYFGGMKSVREHMGFVPNSKPNGYWDEWSNLESEMQSFTVENDDRFPRIQELKVAGRFDLAQAIYKHGGIYTVRKKMGYQHVDEVVLQKYSSELASAYMKRAESDSTFGGFIESVRCKCKTERDLKAFLGITEENKEEAA